MPLNRDTMARAMLFADFPSLLACTRVSKEYREDAQSCLRGRVKGILARFIHDVDGFRAILDRIEGVVSGSVVLQLLNSNCKWQPSDMDVYVPLGPGFDDMLRYLTEDEHFSVISLIDGIDIYAAGIRQVVKLRRHSDSAGIDLILSRTSSTLYPLLHFYSTHVMNFISSNAIGCFYPRLTLSNRGVLSALQLPPSGAISPRIQRCIAKYETRGFEFAMNGYDWADMGKCRSGPYCMQSVRKAGDSGCLFVPIQDDLDRRKRFPNGKFTNQMGVCWVLGGLGCDRSCRLTPYPGVFVEAVASTVGVTLSFADTTSLTTDLQDLD